MKKLSVSILPKAQENLIDIWFYIAESSQDEGTADRFYQYLLNICYENLALFPKMGRKREDLKKGLRYHPVGKYNYLIFYSIRDDELLIESIIQGSKDYTDSFR